MKTDILALLQQSRQLQKKCRPSLGPMTTLPHERKVFIYQRQSSYEQKKRHIWSQAQQDHLAILAKEDGYSDELIYVEKRDLGISGSKTDKEREGLAYLIILVKKDEVESIWVIECSRLYRDMEYINADRLLLLLREHRVIIVTPQRRFDLSNYSDWEAIHQEMIVAVRDSYTRTQKLGGGRTAKALCGLYAGSPVIPGYIIDKNKNSQTYDKYIAYRPYKEIVTEIFREVIAQGGSKLKTARVLQGRGLQFPFFPPEYQYMQTRTSLKRCPRSATGYIITPSLIQSLIPNPRLLGWWPCDGNIIYENHEPIIDEELFIAANKALMKRDKPRGRGFGSKPLLFANLLWYRDHDTEHRISAHGAEGRYTEDRDYQRGIADICLDINHRFIDEPLVDCILSRCSFEVYADEILGQLETEYAIAIESSRKAKQDQECLRMEIKNLRHNLEQTLAQTTNLARIESIERLIAEREAKLNELESSQQETRPPMLTKQDIARVRAFLANLREGWYHQTPELQNEFLKIVLEKVVLREEGDLIEAIIHWRMGVKYKVIIRRPPAKSRRENRWREDEDKLIRMLYPSSSQDVVLAALPKRSWNSITCRANRLGLKRERNYHPPKLWCQWTIEEDQRLKELYESGTALEEIVATLHRTRDAIEVRASQRKLSRPRDVRWKRFNATWDEQPYNFVDNDALCLGR